MRDYEKLSNDVLAKTDSSVLLTRTSSARQLERKFYDEEQTYLISTRDVEIKRGLVNGDESYCEGILVSYCRELNELEKDGHPKAEYIDMVISDFGTFISDWY